MPLPRRTARLLPSIGVLVTAAALAAGCGSAASAGPTSSPNGCDPNYQGACVPDDGYDYDCADIGAQVIVVGSDPDGLDRDGDGFGCESYG